MLNKVLVSKNDNTILIVCDGKKLVINQEHKMWDVIKAMSKEEIKEWYLGFKQI